MNRAWQQVMPKALLPVTKASFRYHIFFFGLKKLIFSCLPNLLPGKNNL